MYRRGILFLPALTSPSDYEGTPSCLVFGNVKMMDRIDTIDMIEEIKRTLYIEIRLNSKGSEYLEGVINKRDLELLNPLLKKYLGPAAKESGKEAYLPQEIEKIVDAFGGLRNEQSFFYRKEGNIVIYASIWPWASNPDKITLKCGIGKLVLSG